MATEGNIQAAIDAGRQLADLKILNVDPGASVPLALVPDGVSLQDLTGYLPQTPDRKRAAITLYDVPSFVLYVNEHKEAASRVFAQTHVEPYTFVAWLDFHGEGLGSASWCTHTATMTLEETHEFKVWMAKNEEHFTQEEFALFVEDHRYDIIEPEGAEVLEIVETLKLMIDSKFVAVNRLNDGNKNLQWIRNVEANAGVEGQIGVPPTFMIRLSLFEGAKPVDIEARLRFNPRQGRLHFSYQLIRVRDAVQDALDKVVKQVHKDGAITVFKGSVRVENRIPGA